MDARRILVVDDEPTITAVLRSLLEEKGCEVAVAASGDEARESLAGGDIAVALVDIHLGEDNGLDLLEEIRDTSPETETIVMTGSASLETALRAIVHGAYSYIQKPFDEVEEVWLAVARAVEKRRLAQFNRDLVREQEKQNRRLTDAVARLSSLLEAGRAMGESQSLEELLDFFVGLIAEELGVERVSIMLVDESQGHLQVAASRGIDQVDATGVRVEIGQGISGSVALAGKPLVVQDSSDCSVAIMKNDPGMSSAFVCAPIVLAIPIKAGARVLGVINATNRRSGKPFDEHDLAYLKSVGGQIAVAIERNFHFGELKKAYDSLRTTQDRLVATERLKALGQMAAGVAHDLNNSLSVVLGKAQAGIAFLRGSPSDPGRARAALETIERVSQQAAETIRRIQDYTRIRKDQPHAPVSLSSAIREAIALTRPKWKEEPGTRGATVEVRLDLAQVPQISGSLHELTQALGNLIYNAVDAMPSGGTLTFRTREENGRVVLELEDTGEGMTEESQSRLFEPFFTTKTDGQGLGTSIVFGIVTRHRGEIAVRSRRGEGTCFRMTFPAAPADAPEPVAEDAPPCFAPRGSCSSRTISWSARRSSRPSLRPGTASPPFRRGARPCPPWPTTTSTW